MLLNQICFIREFNFFIHTQPETLWLVQKCTCNSTKITFQVDTRVQNFNLYQSLPVYFTIDNLVSDQISSLFLPHRKSTMTQEPVINSMFHLFFLLIGWIGNLICNAQRVKERQKWLFSIESTLPLHSLILLRQKIFFFCSQK